MAYYKIIEGAAIVGQQVNGKAIRFEYCTQDWYFSTEDHRVSKSANYYKISFAPDIIDNCVSFTVKLKYLEMVENPF